MPCSKLCRVLVVVAALAVFASFSYAHDWSGVVARASQSVHRLAITEEDGSEDTCSAVLIAKVPEFGLYVSAGHCAVPLPTTIDQKDAVLVKFDADYDLALFIVYGARGTPIVIRRTLVRAGEQAAIIGFGLAQTRQKECFGWISDPRDEVPGEKVAGLFLDATIVGGHSGGAVLDYQGRLITVVQAAVGNRTYLGVGSSQEALWAFVRGYVR